MDEFNRLNPQPKNIPELKTVLLMILDELLQEAIENQLSASASVRALASMQKAQILNISRNSLVNLVVDIFAFND